MLRKWVNKRLVDCMVNKRCAKKSNNHLLLMIFLICFTALLSAIPEVSIHAQKSYTDEVSLDEEEVEQEKKIDSYLVEDISTQNKIDSEDIRIIDKKILLKVYDVEFSYRYYDEYMEEYDYDESYLEIEVGDDSSFSQEEKKQAFIKKIMLEYSDIDEVEIIDADLMEVKYQVTYQLYTESDEYKKSVADFFGATGTKKDKKAVLSKVALYIQGYHVPYLLEDGGEFYIPADTQLDFIYGGLTEKSSKTFYNLKWTTTKKKGSVIGKITYDSSENMYYINKLPYQKLSELFPEWRKELTYVKKGNYFYYGKKPSTKEMDLKKDVIYTFVKKTVAGCKTTKEKVKALHDAIVLRCYYDIKNMTYYNSKLLKKYDMTESQGMALHILQDKKGVCENYARLFKECCDRLFIPCDLVRGVVSGGGHMWNRLYIGSKQYHIDVTFADYLNNNYKKASDIRRTYYLKSAYDFMGSHSWSDADYTPYKFSTKWKSIDRNNIKTTEQLRKAAVYAAYKCRNGKKATYKFKITGSGVNVTCGQYVISYGYVMSIRASYNNGVLTMIFNENIY